MKEKLVNLLVLMLVLMPGAAFTQTGKVLECVIANDHDCVRAAVKAGADVNESDNMYGTTPLMMACNWEGYEEMVGLLLDLGADPRLEDKRGNTALMAAAGVSRQTVELLLDHGCDPRHANEAGTTAFTNCITGILMGRVDTGLAALFLENGANVDEAALTGPAAGYTPLMMAARNASPGLVRFLAEKGADLNAKAADGNTPLSLARKEGDESMVKLLQELGAH